MAISLPKLIQIRKYPFFIALFILFLCVLIFIISSSDSPPSYFSSSSSLLRQEQQQQQPPPPPPHQQSPPTISSPPPTLPLPSPSTSVVPLDPIPSLSSSSPPSEAEVESVAPISDSPGENRDDQGGVEEAEFEDLAKMKWESCRGSESVDYIPCLDNWKAIKKLKSRRHMEHRERHCPSPNPRCLVPIPHGYKIPIPWPRSRDMIWYDNVPHPKLVEYKKDQNWVQKAGDYLRFPGGGTQFKQGVSSYIKFIEKTLPDIRWGKNIRVVLDVGCGVASFGGYLLDRSVISMSFAPKDEHESQIQFALERGIPATLSVIGTQKLTFPDNAYDLIHCARCRVHWDGEGGRPLMELNRILRPGGFFIWSATPVYRDDDRDRNVWNAMVSLTKAVCWKVLAKTQDQNGIGIVIYQKPVSSACYEQREVQEPPMCEAESQIISWYTPLARCLPQLPPSAANWPPSWPERLNSVPVSLSDKRAEDAFVSDSKHWSVLVSDVYLNQLGIKWTSVRNVLDMNAAYGGFAAALIDKALWVMNVVPVHEPNTLSVIFDRGLIGTYHDWCEPLNTYPRTYDLLHSNFLFTNLPERCDMVDVIVEVDRVVRPEGWVLVHDAKELLVKVSAILRSLHWTVRIHKGRYLVGQKGYWRPNGGQVQR